MPSHHRNVGLLAHHQPENVRPTTHIPRGVAAELIRRLAAEPIRQGVIRMMPPSSAIAKTAGIFAEYFPDKLPPREVENCKFVGPPGESTSIPRTHYLQSRREKFGEWQMQQRLLLDGLSA